MVVQGSDAERRLRLVPRTGQLLTVRQVAEQLAVSTATVYALVERGELRHVRVSNAIRVASVDLDAYLAAQRRSGSASGEGPR
jgi:excisionase family DNA binding protein